MDQDAEIYHSDPPSPAVSEGISQDLDQNFKKNWLDRYLGTNSAQGTNEAGSWEVIPTQSLVPIEGDVVPVVPQGEVEEGQINEEDQDIQIIAEIEVPVIEDPPQGNKNKQTKFLMYK